VVTPQPSRRRGNHSMLSSKITSAAEVEVTPVEREDRAVFQGAIHRLRAASASHRAPRPFP